MESQNLESCLKLKIPLLVFCMLDLDCHETLGVSRNDKKQTIAPLQGMSKANDEAIYNDASKICYCVIARSWHNFVAIYNKASFGIPLFFKI